MELKYRVFNEDKTQELREYDLNAGYLKRDAIFVQHEAIEAVEPQSYMEDGKVVINVEGVEAREAYDEYEQILVYCLYTRKELAKREIADLKYNLRKTDYKALKFAEGYITSEEYAETKAQRQAWRDRINELELIEKGEQS